MFGMSATELVIILVIALLVLGPKELPNVAKTLGKTLRDVRQAGEDLRDSFQGEMRGLMDDRPPPRVPPPGATARMPAAVPPPAGVLPAAPAATPPTAPPAPPGPATLAAAAEASRGPNPVPAAAPPAAGTADSSETPSTGDGKAPA